jgi:hypothetical protein
VFAGSMDVVQDVLGILSGAEHVASYEFFPPEHFWTEDALISIRVFITNVKGTFFGMSESEEASKRR